MSPTPVGRLRLDTDPSRGVAVLELTRPHTGNAMDRAFGRELDAATAELADLDRNGAVDCVVIRSQGRNFCVGGDLHEFPLVAEQAFTRLHEMATVAHRAVARLHDLEVPVVCRVDGAVAGAGLGLVLAADLVVASDRAFFVPAYGAAALVPDAGVSWALPRVVGPRLALDILLTNRRLTAAEALAIGLVSRVVPADALDATVHDVVTALLNQTGPVLREGKRLLRTSATNSLRGHLAQEADAIAHFAAAPEAQARIAALLAPANPEEPAPTNELEVQP